MVSAELRATLIGIGTIGAMVLLVLFDERHLILHEAVPIVAALIAALAMVVLVRLGRCRCSDAGLPAVPIGRRRQMVVDRANDPHMTRSRITGRSPCP